ncbi:hypothetical protein OHV05_07205 [Kitasatospora sp. NBC_00070]|uniref:hypothetical protein n=1 Tax=Kitasatospora sp. NBC_00070 TaxID=2975962 RepID=UPI003250F5D9
MKKTVLLGLAALLLTACGPIRPDEGTESSPAPLPSASSASSAGTGQQRAAQLAAAWPGSAAEQVWRSGYHPLDPRQQWLPANAFHDEGDRLGYLGGQLDLTAALPPAPAGTEVFWRDGGRLALPLLPPEQVFRQLVDGRSCHDQGCRRLQVTEVRAGTRPVATSRGRATVPVWEFTVAGYTEPFAYPAVAPQQPSPPGGPVPDELRARSVGLGSVSPDGLTVTGSPPQGGCDRVTGAEAYETDRVVVLIGHLLPPTAEACAAVLRFSPVTVRLARPLGDRVVLDLGTGLPQLPPEQQ